jgi:hypothetical protein
MALARPADAGRELRPQPVLGARRRSDALEGAPARAVEDVGRALAAWPDLEVRRAGRGIVVRARAPWFSEWWHDRETWNGDPMDPVHAWIAEDERRSE